MDIAQPTTQRPGYVVVVNDYQRYSIWPAAKPIPRDWARIGKQGTLCECLVRIGEAVGGPGRR